MRDYVYDETFDGLLTCIYEHYYGGKQGKAARISGKTEYTPSFLAPTKEIVTDLEKAKKVYDAIRNKISYDALMHIYHVFLSEREEKEILILTYVQMGFRMGKDIDKCHANEIVSEIQKWNKRVAHEAHRFLGYIRFAQLPGNVLYAKIKPDHDIIPLLADHFIDRYKNERFIIFDERRHKALISDYGKWYISEFQLDVNQMDHLAVQENYETLWKAYFQSITIGQRENPRCQMNFVPKKYRSNLVEFEK